MIETLDLRVAGWLQRDCGSAAERGTFGELEIAVGDAVFTELLDAAAMTVRRHARVSMSLLAAWFAQAWWRLRWEPMGPGADWRMSHALAAAGGGFLWPDIQFASDGETVLVTSSASAAASPIRYLSTRETVVSADAFERAIDRFMECVLGRLDGLGLHGTDVARLWEDVLAERADPASSRRRILEARLGVDPDELPTATVDALTQADASLGTEAVDEIAAAAKAADLLPTLERLRALDARAGAAFDVSAFLAVPTSASAGATPWERGHQRARAVRAHFGLKHQPLRAKALAELVGTEMGEGRATPPLPRLGIAFRDPARPQVFRAVFSRGRRQTARRFEVARLIGDSLIAPLGDRVLPLSDAATARQKFQRAFAQELLCPIDGLKSLVSLPAPTDDELTHAAAHFEVSEWTVIATLVNRGLVSRSYLQRLQA